MTIDRPTLVAALVTLAAAAPVYLVMQSLVSGVERLAFAAADATRTEATAVVGEPVGREAKPEPTPASGSSEPAAVARVTGTLRTADGTPVPDEAVELSSGTLEARYSATSDARGRFAMADVAPGSGYEVRVSSQGRYREHWQQGLVVPDEGLTLELVLEPLAGARLAGRMVDAEGVPIPGRTLLLEASHGAAQLLVTGDERGHFRIEDAPTGRLTFTTRTVPHLKVRGPLLTPAAEQEVLLVLDEGSHQLGGRVVGDRDAPVRGAQLKLSWSHKQGGSISSSARTAVTDSDGGFRFTDLGPGPHRLAVRAEGYEEARETYGVFWNSRDVELRLRPDYR